MENLQDLLEQYFDFCQDQKALDEKTLKAYRIDLRQFRQFIEGWNEPLSKLSLESYCRSLHRQFKPRTAKRKIASAKAFCHWLEYEEIVESSPFVKVRTQFREPQILPRVISISAVTAIFQAAYQELKEAKTSAAYRTGLRNAAMLELLFATGMRVSELTHLMCDAIRLDDGQVRVYGKGDKERMIQISSEDTLDILRRYQKEFEEEIAASGFFLLNSRGHRLSEQSARSILRRCAQRAGVAENVTPHVFRHTVATLLLEAGVDIRYIQQFLGHSSISVTEIYTHVSTSRQREILTEKHPRKEIHVSF